MQREQPVRSSKGNLYDNKKGLAYLILLSAR